MYEPTDAELSPHLNFTSFLSHPQEYTLDIFFKQAWNDPRLQHELQKPILLSGSEKGNFWLPDTFFLNVKTAEFHHVPAANSRVLINSNGDIELSER